MSSSHQTHTHNQFYLILNTCNNSMYTIRKLRTKVLKLHEKLFPEEKGGPAIEGMSEVERTDYAREVEELCKGLRDTYDSLETMCRQLPNEMPTIDHLIRLKNIYAMEHSLELSDNPTLLIENMLDAIYWNEANYSMYQYLTELGLIANRNMPRRRTSVMLPRAVQFTSKDGVASCHTAHVAFENAYLQTKRECAQKNHGVHMKELEKTPLSSAIEFKFHVSADKQVVYMLKFLLIESYGTIEKVTMVAPHEEWKYISDAEGERKLDARQQSRYEVYRRITNSANTTISTMVSQLSHGNPYFRWTANMFMPLIMSCGRYKDVFEAKCRVCRKTMKDFLPPTVLLDFRNFKDNIVHDTCK